MATSSSLADALLVVAESFLAGKVAGATEGTIIPPWYGERLDLDHALYVCLANARTDLDRKAACDQADEPAARRRIQVFEPEGWADRMRQYYDEHATRRRPVQVPIPV